MGYLVAVVVNGVVSFVWLFFLVRRCGVVMNHTAVLEGLDPVEWRYVVEMFKRMAANQGKDSDDWTNTWLTPWARAYSFLRPLEEYGYVESKWDHPESESEPRMRLYRLTATGVQRLAEARSQTITC